MRLIQTTVTWVAMLTLVILPFIVALDYGGILRWTQYLAAFPVIACACLAGVLLISPQVFGGIQRYWLLVILLLWLGFSYAQTVELDGQLVSALSPGSYDAYSGWLKGILPASELPDRFPVSIGVHYSRHACAMIAIVTALAFAAITVFSSRTQISVLICGVSLGCGLHTLYGIVRLFEPSVDLGDSILGAFGSSFGSFVNRNNAALMMNLGLGASQGLLAWRLLALTGQEVDDEQFEFNDLAALIGDRDSMLGILGSTVCGIGLLLCGSRGGLVSAMVGLLLAFGWIRQRRGLMSVPVVGVVMAIACAILLVPLEFESVNRFSSTFEPGAAGDGRFQHWPEGFRAGLAHLPMGSGLATYAYAYLPHQETELFGWSHHADNLWLELFVEQGAIGILFASAIILLCMRSLHRLRRSPDPVDHGLRTCGWYCLGAILVSQALDFGLILPGNLFLVTILISAIVSREYEIKSILGLDLNSDLDSASEAEKQDLVTPVESSLQKRPPSSRFATGVFQSIVFRAVIVACGIGVGVLALPQLRRSALVESLVRSCEHEIRAIATNQQALTDWSQELHKHLGGDPEPSLLNTLAHVEYRRARLSEVVYSRPKSVDESSELYRLTNHANRRVKELPNNTKFDESMTMYAKAKSIYADSLRSLPLGLDNRAGQLYLDFVDIDPKRTRVIIEQLHRLHHNKPKAALLLGEYAADSNENDLAAMIWKSAINVMPNLAPKVIDLSKRYNGLAINDVLPSDPRSVRAAARHLIETNDAEGNSYLPFALDKITCEECDSLEEKADCLSLRGDIAYRLGQFDFAAEQYQTAIDSDPTNAALRITLIERLRDQGRDADARVEARKGRFVMPQDNRFDALIQSMAAEDVDRAKKMKAERDARKRSLQTKSQIQNP